MRIALKNGRVVNPFNTEYRDVLIEDGIIIKVGENLSGDKNIDVSHAYVMPGFIDPHTHFDLDLGTTVTADNFDTGSRAALLGGTTTVIDFATQDRDGTLVKAFEEWQKKAEGSSCNYGFHMAIARWDEQTRGEMTVMTGLGVTSYKVYMVYDSLRLDDGAIYSALCAAKEQGAMLSAHCENYFLLNKLIEEQKSKGILGPVGHPLSRPALVEAEAVSRFLRIAQLAAAPAYVVHLSTRDGLYEGSRARERGQTVYLETCPQYLLLNEDCYIKPDGAKYVMSPPLRKTEDSIALWQGIKGGQIDTIGTDHCSFTLEQKALGKDDFTKIPNGAAGVFHRGLLMYTHGVAQNRMTINQMVRLLSYNPAKLFGMENHGEIIEGKAADIVVLDPGGRSRITDGNHPYNTDNCIFAGLALEGRIKHVILNGVHAVDDGKLVEPGCGKYIKRGRAGSIR